MTIHKIRRLGESGVWDRTWKTRTGTGFVLERFSDVERVAR